MYLNPNCYSMTVVTVMIKILLNWRSSTGKLLDGVTYSAMSSRVTNNFQGSLRCAVMPCHCRIVLLLIKERKLMLYLPAPLRSFGEARPAGSKARLCSCSWDTFYCERSEAKLISDISMRICSEASIAEIPCRWRCFFRLVF